MTTDIRLPDNWADLVGIVAAGEFAAAADHVRWVVHGLGIAKGKVG